MTARILWAIAMIWGVAAGTTATGSTEVSAGPQPLHEAIRAGNLELVGRLLREGADPNAAWDDYYGATPLMLAAETDAGEVASLLLEHGANPDAQDANGDTALNWAAYYGWREFAGELLAVGADPALAGHGNAFEIALRRGHRGLVQDLAEHMGLSIDPATPAARLDAAVMADDAQALVELIAAGIPADATDIIGQTALMIAARDVRPRSVTALLAAGADPNHVSAAEGLALTPLHMAAIGGDQTILAALIAAGAQVGRPDRLGNTPLMWAFMEQQTATMEVLLAAGADAKRTNQEGDSVASLAERYGLVEVEALINAGGS